MEYKFVVIECGSTAQIQLNAEQWRSVYRTLHQVIDPDQYLGLSEILSKNSKRTVLGNNDLRKCLSKLNMVMFNLSSNASEFESDYQYRIDVLKLLIFIFHAIRSGANIAFNFVCSENDMAVFPPGMYVVGELSSVFEDFPETVGVFQHNGVDVAQYECGVSIVHDHLDRSITLGKSPYRIGIVRCDYVFDDKLKELMLNPDYARRYHIEKPFRVSKFWNIINMEKDVICFGHVQFEVPHVKN